MASIRPAVEYPQDSPGSSFSNRSPGFGLKRTFRRNHRALALAPMRSIPANKDEPLHACNFSHSADAAPYRKQRSLLLAVLPSPPQRIAFPWSSVAAPRE